LALGWEKPSEESILTFDPQEMKAEFKEIYGIEANDE
jgi:hypothetical protein